MALLTTHAEIDQLAGGRVRHVQHMKAIASYKDGSLRRDPMRLSATGSADWPVAVDGICDVRIAPRIAGKSPVLHVGHGKDSARFALVNANNVKGSVKGNSTLFVNAWNNADLRYEYGGNVLRESISLRANHPRSFAVLLHEHTGFDPLTMTIGSLRIQQPTLEKGDVTVPLKWLVTQQGGKWLLTVTLPEGDWAGWVVDPSLVLQPSAADGVDTYVAYPSPTTNYGTSTSIYVRGTLAAPASQRNGLIAFDLSSIPATATVTAATMTFIEIATPYGTGTISLYPILVANTGWAEAGATWNTKDGANAWAGGASGCGTPGTDYAVGRIGSFQVVLGDTPPITRDVSLAIATVQTWCGTSNDGVVMENNDFASLAYVASSDHATASYRPKLVVEYTLPSGRGARNLFLGHLGAVQQYGG